MLTPSKLAQAIEMRSRKQPWTAVCYAIGESEYVVRAALDPAWAETRRRQARDGRARRNGTLIRRPREVISQPSMHMVKAISVPLSAVAERDRVFSLMPTIHQRLLGDPLPGRSALDKRRGA